MATACALRTMNFPIGHQSAPVIDTQMLAGLSDRTNEALRKASMPLSYTAGDRIFSEGQPAKGMFILRHGKAKLVASSPEGKALILRIATTGAVLGLSSSLNASAHDISAEALETCQVNFIRRADLLQLMKENGDLALQLAKELSLEYAGLCQELATIGLQRSAVSRLAQLLVGWIEDGSPDAQEVRVECGLTHETIAQLIGTSRETVTRLLHDLRVKRIGTMKDSYLTVHKLSALRALIS
jgi:CRP/FNR family cyclic AMP-dependent transcriptional regulator